MGVMEALTALLTITLPIIGTLVPTIVLTNRQTLKLLGEIKTTQEGIKRVQEDTTCLLRKVRDTQERMVKVQEDTTRTLKHVRKVQADTACLLRKIDVGMKANARMHGWRREDNVSSGRAKKLPKPKVYDSKLRICYYRAA